MDKVKVEWFDELKGIGEGLTSDGKEVFLNIRHSEALPNTFNTLKVGEVVECEIQAQFPDRGYFATRIIRKPKKPSKPITLKDIVWTSIAVITLVLYWFWIGSAIALWRVFG